MKWLLDQRFMYVYNVISELKAWSSRVYICWSISSESAGARSRLLSPSWSVKGSGLWLACPRSLSESQRPGCDWHPALCTVQYVWPAQLKLTKLGLFLQAGSRPLGTPKSPQALNRQRFCTYFLFLWFCTAVCPLIYTIRSSCSESRP